MVRDAAVDVKGDSCGLLPAAEKPICGKNGKGTTLLVPWVMDDNPRLSPNQAVSRSFLPSHEWKECERGDGGGSIVDSAAWPVPGWMQPG